MPKSNDALINAVNGLTSVVTLLADIVKSENQNNLPAPVETKPKPVQKENESNNLANQITQKQVIDTLKPIVASLGSEVVTQFLNGYGVNKVSELNPDDYQRVIEESARLK